MRQMPFYYEEITLNITRPKYNVVECRESASVTARNYHSPRENYIAYLKRYIS